MAPGRAWAYRERVKATDECPAIAVTSVGETPLPSMCDMAVCLRSWNHTLFRPGDFVSDRAGYIGGFGAGWMYDPPVLEPPNSVHIS